MVFTAVFKSATGKVAQERIAGHFCRNYNDLNTWCG